MLPERSMTIANATASLRCSRRNSIDTGSSGSTALCAYPPEPNDCLPPAMSNPPPCTCTYNVERVEEFRREFVRGDVVEQHRAACRSDCRR